MHNIISTNNVPFTKAKTAKQMSPETWKRKMKTFAFLLGAVLRDPSGSGACNRIRKYESCIRRQID